MPAGSREKAVLLMCMFSNGMEMQFPLRYCFDS